MIQMARIHFLTTGEKSSVVPISLCSQTIFCRYYLIEKNYDILHSCISCLSIIASMNLVKLMSMLDVHPRVRFIHVDPLNNMTKKSLM